MIAWHRLADAVTPWSLRPAERPAAEGAMPAPRPGWPGRLDGVWHWRLPDTPNGLKPTQCWHAVGSSPGGDIYVAGMDHATNAALYRIGAGDGLLRYVGDARSASQAARNWRRGETVQKFHTRPTWANGRVHVATMDHSTLDRGYRRRRGFHLYAYDEAAERFIDLSAAEPQGVGARHGALVALAHDPTRNVLYGVGVPTADLFRHDLAGGRTTKLGRPRAFDSRYLYAARVLWVDSRGLLYFTAGNPAAKTRYQSPAIYGHVHVYDPEAGFGERRDWPLRACRALELGQWTADRKTCFLADDQGEIYRFDDEGPRWSHLGRAEVPASPSSVWLFHVDAQAAKAYVVTSTWAEQPASLYQFDLATGRTRRLCLLDDLSPALAGLTVHTGHDALDRQGRFHFASFAKRMPENLLVTRIDPSALLPALGL